jgi:hypothetical protein
VTSERFSTLINYFVFICYINATEISSTNMTLSPQSGQTMARMPHMIALTISPNHTNGSRYVGNIATFIFMFRAWHPQFSPIKLCDSIDLTAILRDV